VCHRSSSNSASSPSHRTCKAFKSHKLFWSILLFSTLRWSDWGMGMLSVWPYPQSAKASLCNSEQHSVSHQGLLSIQTITKKAKRINEERRKGICTQTRINFRHSFSISGRRWREESTTCPLVLRSVIWRCDIRLGSSPNSGSHLLFLQLLHLNSDWVCCHVSSEDMLTIFASPRIYIVQLFVKAPPIPCSTSFLIFATEIQS